MLKIKCFCAFLEDRVVTLRVSLKKCKSALFSVHWASAVGSTDLFRMIYVFFRLLILASIGTAHAENGYDQLSIDPLNNQSTTRIESLDHRIVLQTPQSNTPLIISHRYNGSTTWQHPTCHHVNQYKES
ncbi:MAG: hypothetical protein V3T17_04380 [Pseudomonadales bacterium]